MLVKRENALNLQDPWNDLKFGMEGVVLRDENASNTDGYYWYHICFYIFGRIQIWIRIISIMSDKIRLDVDIINIQIRIWYRMLDIQTWRRIDLNIFKRIWSNIKYPYATVPVRACVEEASIPRWNFHTGGDGSTSVRPATWLALRSACNGLMARLHWTFSGTFMTHTTVIRHYTVHRALSTGYGAHPLPICCPSCRTACLTRWWGESGWQFH